MSRIPTYPALTTPTNARQFIERLITQHGPGKVFLVARGSSGHGTQRCHFECVYTGGDPIEVTATDLEAREKTEAAISHAMAGAGVVSVHIETTPPSPEHITMRFTITAGKVEQTREVRRSLTPSPIPHPSR